MEKKKTKRRNKFDPLSILLAGGLIAVDMVISYQILFAAPLSLATSAHIYFLDFRARRFGTSRPAGWI